MSDLILYSFLATMVLIIWFETDAFVEYLAALVGGERFFKLNDYKEMKQRTGVSYPDFLAVKYDNFFINLITCPICIGIWLNIFLSLAHKSLLYFVVGAYCSIALYFIFKILMKKSDEVI